MGASTATTGSSDAAPPAGVGDAAGVALDRLLSGNERFVTAKERHRHQDEKWMASLREGQHPFATILGCADSRFPPELLFDQGFGDLFVVRVAGHVIDEHVLGSLEYASIELGTPLVMVLGHENCGAVTAALELGDHPAGVAADVRSVLRAITPAIAGVDRALEPGERARQAVEANVRWTVLRVRAALGAAGVDERRVAVVGAVVGFETGRVRLLD
jgi:carbonic anhydrase